MSGGEARRPLVVGNWKMNLPETWARRLVDDLLPLLEPAPAAEVALAPSFTSLAAVRAALEGHAVGLAAQNMHWEDDGAYTGEISPRMLVDAGVGMVILGHSERRTLFGETDERVRRKTAAARRHRLVPVVCVGETESQRDSGRTLSIVEHQLRVALSDLTAEDAGGLVVAYEPVWAIGTGRTATPDQVDEVHRLIREQLASMHGQPASQRVRILYGGSVNAENAAELLGLAEVDGALVGGASLDPKRFATIVRAAG